MSGGGLDGHPAGRAGRNFPARVVAARRPAGV